MAKHRPTATLLALIQQALANHPDGLAPRQLMKVLESAGEDISRPTLNRLLPLGIAQKLWSSQGAGRSVVYISGAEISAPPAQTNSLATSQEPPAMFATPEQLNSAPTEIAKAVASSRRGAARQEAGKPAGLHQQVRDMVWWIADTLRDKTGLQVESYQPVTLALMALKRNMDIQAEQLRDGGSLADDFAAEVQLVEAGIRQPHDVALTLNQANQFWNPTELLGARSGLSLMTWADFAHFLGGHVPPGSVGHRIVLRANPEGHRTDQTALFTYTTRAQDLKALLLEIIDSLVPDLREAFGAIGIHSVLGPQSEHAASLSDAVLREICTTIGNGQNRRLYDFDLGREAISTDLFSDTYMDLLGRFAEDSGKRGGEYFTPTPLVLNAIDFLPIDAIALSLASDPTKILRIGDPTGGSNTFLVKTHEAITHSVERQGLPALNARQFAFYAQELKNTQVGLGVFNMFYHGLASRLNPTELELNIGRPLTQGGIVSRITGNTITEYVDKIGQHAGKLDLIVANPPYGTDDYGVVYANGARNHPRDKRWIAGVPTRSEGEWGFVQTIVDLLSPTGRAAVVLPLGVLFRDGGGPFRQWLIEKDWIEGVIATPSNQFLTTSIPVCILLINKAKDARDSGKVFFVNASEDFTKTGKFNHWNVETALTAWKTRDERPGYSGYVSQERLRKTPGYSLAVNRWFSLAKTKVEVDISTKNSDIKRHRDFTRDREIWLDDIFEKAAKAINGQRIGPTKD